MTFTSFYRKEIYYNGVTVAEQVTFKSARDQSIKQMQT